LPQKDADAVIDCLRKMNLLQVHPVLRRTDELFAGLEEFRQHLGGRLTITMLQKVGQPVDIHEIDHERMKQAIEYVVGQVSQIRD
jgi:3-dehydroquinate synthase